MRRWKPQPALGLWIGIVLLILVLAGSGFLATRLIAAFARPPEAWIISLPMYGELVGLFALLLFAGLLAYRVIGGLTLVYEIDRNGLYIIWMGNRAVIPLSQIESIESGIVGARIPWHLLQGIGYYWGQGRTPDGHPLHLFTTRSLARSLVLHTGSDSYAISPSDQDAFVHDLEQRRRLGAIKPLTPTVEPGRMLFYAFWNDPVIRWTIIVMFGLNLLLLGLLVANYAGLDERIATRFDAVGNPTELRPRYQILFLPLASFGLSLLNTGLGLLVYRRDHTSAHLLQFGSVLVQILFGIAIILMIAR